MLKGLVRHKRECIFGHRNPSTICIEGSYDLYELDHARTSKVVPEPDLSRSLGRGL